MILFLFPKTRNSDKKEEKKTTSDVVHQLNPSFLGTRANDRANTTEDKLQNN